MDRVSASVVLLKKSKIGYLNRLPKESILKFIIFEREFYSQVLHILKKENRCSILGYYFSCYFYSVEEYEMCN